MRTLIDLLTIAQQQAPTKGITIIQKGKECSISYPQLLSRAQAALGLLQEKGLRPGDQLVLQLDDIEQFLYFFWGAVLGGVIPVPLSVDSQESRQKLLRVWNVLESPYLVISSGEWQTITSYLERVAEGSDDVQASLPFMDKVVFSDDVLGERLDSDPDITLHRAEPEDIAFLQFSSGSTGDPKGVKLSHQNLLTNIRAIVQGAEGRAADKSLSWMPLTHDMGLIGFHLVPMFSQNDQYLMPPSLFVTRPMRWMELVHKHRITVTSSPNFGYYHFLRHFKSSRAQNWDLSCLRLIFNGAEPISYEICQQFLQTLEPYGLRNEVMYPVYGMAEASLAVTFPPVKEQIRALRVQRSTLGIGEKVQRADGETADCVLLVDVGYPLQDCQLRICSDEQKPLADGYVGNIQIKGLNVTRGYYRRADLDQVTFTADGWLDTGDVGVIVDGRLYVVGRKKELIFVHGQNVYPHDLERVAERVEGVETGKIAVCGLPDRKLQMDQICVFVQFRGGVERFIPLAQAIGQQILKETGHEVKYILPIRHIPKTTSGKIQRFKLIEMIEEGAFDEVIEQLKEQREVNSNEIRKSSDRAGAQEMSEYEKKIYQIWCDVLDTDHIGVDDQFFALGGNSLKAMMISGEIEETFGIELPVSQLLECANIRNLAAVVEQLERTAGHRELAAVSALDRGTESVYAASSVQKRLYVLQQMNPEQTVYHLPQAMIIEGDILPEQFTRAWQKLIERHEALRTSFEMVDGQLYQRIHPEVEFVIHQGTEPLTGSEQIEAKIRSFIRSFDLNKAPLCRVELVPLDGKRHLFLFDMHHIIADGTSLGILIRDFVQLYEGKTLEPLAVQYKEIAEWKRNLQEKGELDRQLQYWRERFSTGVPVLQLPTDYPRPAEQSFCGDRLELCVGTSLTAALNELAREQQITLYIVLLSAYYLLLRKYSGQQEVVIGTAVAGRTQKVSRSVVGLFVNTLPLYIRIGEAERFTDLLQVVKQEVYSALQHQDLPFEEIIDLPHVRRERGRHPLFDTMFTLQNIDIPELKTETLTFTPYPLPHDTAKFDLTWECYEEEQGLKFVVEYTHDLFERETVERMFTHYVHILEQIVQQPQIRFTEVELTTTTEKERLTVFGSARSVYPKSFTLSQLFERQVELTPGSIALVNQAQTLTYEELNAKANQLARYLERMGVDRHTRVALIFNRSPEMIISILAVLKAGGTYVPLDPQYPLERLQLMVKDAQVEMVLSEVTYRQVANSLQHGDEQERKVVVVEEIIDQLQQYATDNLPRRSSAEDIAYIMYTSGSTGQPKGILTKHYNVSRVVKETNYIELTEEDALLQLSNYAFDGSTFDIYGALLNGTKLVLVDKETMLDMSALADWITEHEISVFFTTTALFNTLVDVNLDCLTGVRKILFGGERVSVAHVRKAFQALGPGRLIHVYGPTESTVFATYYEIHYVSERQATIPIGRPISNTEAYVLDEQLQPVPIGVPGELYLSGDGLAQGYLNRPELTQQFFLPHPYEQGKKIYKTGDLVRWLADGNIEFIERIDKQVKIRGYRIELGEIEARLLDVAGIQEAVVDARRKGQEQVLVAYFVAEQQIEQAVIHDFLQETLPYYMLPSAYVQLEKMPLNQNGKVDKRALPEPTMVGQATYVEPIGETEIRLAQIWQSVLQLERVGREDRFLDLGGHSLKASLLSAKIQQQFQVNMPIKEIFRLPTLREHAAWIDQATASSFEPLQRAPEQTYYPLTSAQMRMYVQAQSAGVGVAYNMPLLFKLEGDVDVEKLQNVWQTLLLRHEPLRTSFHWQDGQVVQHIEAHVELPFDVVEAEKETIDDLFAAFVQPFELSRAPLIRLQLVRTNVSQYLMLDIHHIIADGISLKVLLDEFLALYDDRVLDELSFQYKEYALWMEKRLHSPEMNEQVAFWKEMLAGELPVLQMPNDYVRPQRRSFEGDVVISVIKPGLVQRLERLAHRLGVTQHSVFFAVYALLLHKYTGQKEMMIGSLVAGRTHPDVQRMIGMFNNFLPIRTSLDENQTISTTIQRVQQILHDAFEHQDVTYEALTNAVTVQRDPSRNMLFDTMLVVHNELEQLALNGRSLQLIPKKQLQKTAKLDFKLDLYPLEDKHWTAELEYNTALFKRETMERFLAHFEHLLEQATENADSTSAKLELVTEEEKKQILSRFNHTNRVFPNHFTLSSWFEQQVEKTPDRVAVLCGAEQYTYQELNARANRLARLLRKEGVTAESVVGVMLERSLDMIVALLAIHKAGGAYVPIDPHYPSERVRYMVENSDALLICTHRKWNEQHGLERTLYLEETDLDRGDESNLPSVHTPRNLAYVIYTSGSTGRPKGVMVEHEAVINRLHWMQNAYPLNEQDVILQKTPYTFDVSVWELFWWCGVGAKMVFLEPGGEKDPRCIARTIEKERVTTLHFVPSMLHTFLQYVQQQRETSALSTLRYVFTSGEALQVGHVKRFKQLFAHHELLKLVNLYGPTEATVDVSYYECTDVDIEHVPIGRPIQNIRLYVLNERNQLQPVGVPGQLAISGVGLARGYVANEALTTVKFVADPFVRGERMYLTGDLVRWQPDGQIQFLGRIDHQVKIRGVRIECGEVEFVLQQHPALLEVIVSAWTDATGDQQLCAYYTAQRTVDVNELREHVGRLLPEYMIPSRFIQLERFPLTPNGKVDRKALPQPEMMRVDKRSITPARTETEHRLVSLWQDVLGVETLGVHDHFFLLGGHSLKATQLAGRIEAEFEVEMPLTTIFEHTTIEEQARVIDTLQKHKWTDIPQAPQRSHYPLSIAQSRLFILQQMDEQQTTYNLPFALNVKGAIDIQRMEAVLNELIQRHEVLRTSFSWVDEEPVQVIHEQVSLRLERKEATPDQVDQLMAEFVRPFNLTEAPLLRAALIHLAAEEHLLLLDLHHLIADGMSMVNVAEEFIALYQGEKLPPVTVQHKDVTLWQRAEMDSERMKKQERYWLAKMAGEIPLLDLPLDFPRPVEQQYEGEQLIFAITPDLTQRIKRFAQQTDSTLYMVLLTAFKTLLYRYTQQEDLIVGLPVSGRTHPQLERLVGMFVNTLPFRTQPAGDQSFRSYLEDVKRLALEAYEHQDYPFEKLVAQLDLPRHLSRNPLFDVMFVLQSMGIPEVETEDLQFSQRSFNHRISKVDLTFELVEREEGLQLQVEYRTKLFRAQTIRRMVDHYTQLMEQIVAEPEKALAEYELLTEEENTQILSEFNRTEMNYPQHLTVDRWFEEQVRRTPHHIAIRYGEQSLTYQQLDQQANLLAHWLREKGVVPETVVGVMMDRSLEMMIGIFAILKAGGAYVPLAPDLPTARLKYLLQDSGVKLMLVQQDERAFVQEKVKCLAEEQIEIIDLEQLEFESKSTEAPLKEHGPRHRAYVIYTSGSTGRPKGVVIEHRSVINRIHWMQQQYPLTTEDVILQKTPITFDVSVWELFWWSGVGATLHLLAPGGEKDPEQIVKTIEQQRVTTMHFVPSMLQHFLEYVETKAASKKLASLNRVFASGEALSNAQVDRFYHLLQGQQTQLINLYGPTEATVDVSYYDCEAGDKRVPIGKPIANTKLYIVNDRLKLQPIGVPGELCIAGVGLAREYLNRPQLTAEKFVPNPFVPGERMYRTGDLARWLADGQIEYLGRLDHQVKIRGYRIECGEIEHQLLAYPSVQHALVMARSSDQNGDHLCAYVVTDKDVTIQELRSHLAQHLPPYMIPAYFIRLDAFPLLPNGKVDRKSLPAPDQSVETGVKHVEAVSETEKILAQLWDELLERQQIGIHDNFFDIGGNSLLLLKAHQRLDQMYPNKIKIADLFAYPTVAKLAAYLDSLDQTEEQQRIALTGIPLDPSYFNLSGSATGQIPGEYQFRLEGRRLAQFRELATHTGFERSDICFAAYAYLWAQLSKQTTFSVYSIKGEESLVDVSFDFTQIGNVDQLLQQASEQNRRKECGCISGPFTKKELTDVEVVPLFIDQQSTRYTTSPEVFRNVDMILTIDEQAGYIQCRWEYNARRFPKDKMKELVELYIRTLQGVLNHLARS